MRICIFGTGNSANNLINRVKENIEIVCFIDNNKIKQGMTLFGRKIISLEELKNYDYDYIVIASMYYKEIEIQLINAGIQDEILLRYVYYIDDYKSNTKILDKIIVDEKKSAHYRNFDALEVKEEYNINYQQDDDMWSCTSENETDFVVESIYKYMNEININSNYEMVLDVGCAKGNFTEAFRKIGLKSYGIDYSDVAIQMAKENFKKCEFKIIDAFDPKFKQESFDIIFMRGFSGFNTHNIKWIVELIDKYKKILNKEGCIIYAFSSNYTGIEKDNETVNLSKDELKKIINESKLQYMGTVFPYEKSNLIEYKILNKDYYYIILKKS